MTAVLLSMPLNEAACARLTHRQAVANIEADRAECVAIARKALRLAEHQSDAVLRDACATLQAWGDGNDYLTADAMILTLNRKERQRAHEAAKAAAETPAQIAARHLHQWPQIVAWGAVLAVAMLAGTGWL